MAILRAPPQLKHCALYIEQLQHIININNPGLFTILFKSIANNQNQCLLKKKSAIPIHDKKRIGANDQ